MLVSDLKEALENLDGNQPVLVLCRVENTLFHQLFIQNVFESPNGDSNIFNILVDKDNNSIDGYYVSK